MVEIIRELNDQILKKIVRIVDNGGVISFPTETVYALAADASNPTAVEKIYTLKKRSPDKPLPLLIGDIYQAKIIGEFNDRAKKLSLLLFPGPITIILKKKPHNNLANNITPNIDTIGIRMPNNLTALKILQAVGRPLIGTSANISNSESSINAYQVLLAFDEKIDLLVDQGETEIGIPTTIIDLSTDKVKILRKGSISEKRILEILSTA